MTCLVFLEKFLRSQEDWLKLDGCIETRSENARHIILSYKDKLYYVSAVKVHFFEGKETHRAIFHAKNTVGGELEDLDLDIPQKLYDLLVEYTRTDDSDLMLVLHVEGKEFQWGLVSESWLRRYMNGNIAASYIV